jgi:hypothetical protein
MEIEVEIRTWICAGGSTVRRVESYDALATLRPVVEGQRHLATNSPGPVICAYSREQ